MTGRKKAILIGVLTALFGFTGCFSLSRDAPPVQHYVLSSLPPDVSSSPTSNRVGATIGLREPRLAEYLDIPFIIVRRGSNRIMYSDFYRWGEDLAGGINRAVATRLVADGSVQRVDVAPWSAQTEHDYRISIHVTRFEGAVQDPAATQGEVHVMASWEIAHRQDTTALAHGTTEFRQSDWQIDDYDSLVATLEEGIDQLAGDLLVRLGSLEAP